MTSLPQSIAIVGAGITGLTTAWRLHRQGYRVSVFERNASVGGVIASHREGGWLAECGPNSIQESPEIAALIDELGLGAERVTTTPAARNRFIVRRGQPVPVPLSPPHLLTSPLFSLRARVRVLAEFFTQPRVRTTDVSLASFIATHFGQEIVDYALNPFVAGVYAGDPEKLSARHAFPALWQLERQHGSLLRGFRAQAIEKRARGRSGGPPLIISFREGLAALPQAIAAKLPTGSVRTGASVTSLIPGEPWKLIWSQNDTVETAEFDAVVLALPSPALSQLVFGTLGERELASLDHLPHPPVSSVFLGFRREQVAHALNGFGMLVPAREPRSILGVLFASTLFPGRAPEGHVALTVFVGGMRQPDLARLPTEELVARIMPDLRDLLGVSGEPVFQRHNFWPRAIPQYNLGHERFLEPMTQCENQHPGLFIGGNARHGISLPDCVRSGQQLATRAADFVSRR